MMNYKPRRCAVCGEIIQRVAQNCKYCSRHMHRRKPKSGIRGLRPHKGDTDSKFSHAYGEKFFALWDAEYGLQPVQPKL